MLMEVLYINTNAVLLVSFRIFWKQKNSIMSGRVEIGKIEHFIDPLLTWEFLHRSSFVDSVAKIAVLDVGDVSAVSAMHGQFIYYEI